ncbi:MAG: biopolymer transporter ExbD [Acidobacteriota bacterium]
MQVGGSGAVKSDINVTPLVDVVLVLLIIFMVITPIVQMGYLVRVPPKAPPGTPMDLMNDQIILRLLPNNRIMINKEEVTPDQFPQRMREILKGNSSKMVFFSGDRTVNYESTIQFLDMARASGAHNIGIIVEELNK